MQNFQAGKKLMGTHNQTWGQYFEKYSITLQLLWLFIDYNYITITGPVEM